VELVSGGTHTWFWQIEDLNAGPGRFVQSLFELHCSALVSSRSEHDHACAAQRTAPAAPSANRRNVPDDVKPRNDKSFPRKI